MNARRRLTAAVSFVWLLPTLAAGALALHVAFEHPVGHDHEAMPEAGELRGFPAQGQVDPAGHLPHEHSTVAGTGGVAIRRGIDAVAQPSNVAASEIPVSRVDFEGHTPAARVLAGPPKASGPPLLARLSIFRI
ncbi:MAG: hypothetical protein ABI689_01410 [Thermoanaerobaculia bacterium]